jgi:S-adenosylmethionine decarboxylase
MISKEYRVMSVVRSKFAEMVLNEKKQEREVNTFHKFAPRLPSIHVLKKQREMWMQEFRRGLAHTMAVPSVKFSIEQEPLGRHWLADFEISEEKKLELLRGGNPAQTIKQLIVAAAKVAKAHILNEMAFQQSPVGNVIGVVVIQESHLSVHFIPDENFIAVDVFTCGKINFEEAIAFISEQLQAAPHAKIEVKRGILKDDRFIPGIGIQTDAIEILTSGRNHSTVSTLGRHLIMEFYLCNPMTIDDARWVQKVFRQAIVVSGGKLHGDFVHQFQPQGVSDAAIGSFARQTHAGGFCDLTVHDYPELRAENFGAYAAVDFCDFTGHLDFNKLIHFIKTSLKSDKISIHEFLRGAYKLDNTGKKQFVDGLKLDLTQTEPVAQKSHGLRM